VRRVVLQLCAVFCLFLIPLPAESIQATPSNAGFSGLWEYPTARMPGDGKGWIGLSRYHPYAPYYLNLGYLPWLEFNVRLTRFLTSETGRYNTDYAWDDYIDKAIDLKFLLARQRGIFPSVAAGVTDISGTRLLDASYIVATYEWERIAFTLGYGTDRYNGIFGGVEWQPFDWLVFKAEYSPLDYSKDAAHKSLGIAPSLGKEKWNAGVVLRHPSGLDASLSYQRGEEWCWGLGYTFDLSRPLFGGRTGAKTPQVLPEPPAWDRTDFRAAAGRIMEDIQNSLGVRDVHVFFGDRRMLVAYENVAHSSQADVMARALLLTVPHAPSDIEELIMAPRVRGETLVRLLLPGKHCALLRTLGISYDHRGDAAVQWTGGEQFGRLPGEKWSTHYAPEGPQKQGRTTAKLMVTSEVRIDRPTNKPFFMSRQNLDLVVDHRTSSGWAFHLDIRHPLNNDIDIWWEPYLNDATRIQQGVASYSKVLGDGMYALFEAGWLDEMWAGANLWGRKYFGQGDFWLGARASWTHPRDPEGFASLADRDSYAKMPWYHSFFLEAWNPDEWRTSWWLQAGYHEGRHNLDLTAEYGRFINEDQGYRLSAMRWWDDVGLGFYYVATDIKIPGEDYTRVGAMVDIPVGAFWGSSGAQTWTEDIRINSAWVYEGGRQPGAWKTPEQLWGQLQPDRLRNGLYESLERFCSAARGDEKTRTGKVYGIVDEFRSER